MSTALEKLASKMEGMIMENMIKMALLKIVPDHAKENLPKLIDILGIASGELKSYFGKDEKFVILRNNEDGETLMVVVDATKPFSITHINGVKKNSFGETGGEVIKVINLNEYMKGLIDKYLVPIIPPENVHEIGQMSREHLFDEISRMTDDATDHLTPDGMNKLAEHHPDHDNVRKLQ